MLDCLGGAVDGGCAGEEERGVEGVVPRRVFLSRGRGGGEEMREDLAETGGHFGGGEGDGAEGV